MLFRSVSSYKAVGSYTFAANSFQSGGISFDANNPSIVYLSKKTDNGAFEIYRYASTDDGATWAEQELISSNTPDGQLNIRPLTAFNAPADYPLGLFWMRGTYDNPTSYQTSIVCAGEAMAATGISLDSEAYECAVNDVLEPQVRIAPLFAAGEAYKFTSSAPSIVEVTADNKLFCKNVGTATITVELLSNPALTATCKVTVLGQSVYTTFAERVIADVRADKMGALSTLDSNVAQYMANLQADGSYIDVDYASTDRTNWPPLPHLDRQLAMGLAYTHEASAYYGNDELKAKLDLMLTYWQAVKPKSNNWYQNEIAEPQRMGQYLILMHYLGKEKIPTDLFTTAVNRMRSNGGNPGAQAGANRVDVALHWMYRACLTDDADLLKEAMDYIYSTVVYTTGAEGIQYDNSFTQHGRQLHIGSYGDVYIGGTTKACSYAAGTAYAIAGEQLDILSRLVKDTYIGAYRGEYISYNVIGRASSRPNATKKPMINEAKSSTISAWDAIKSDLKNLALSRSEDVV